MLPIFWSVRQNAAATTNYQFDLIISYCWAEKTRVRVSLMEMVGMRSHLYERWADHRWMHILAYLQVYPSIPYCSF